MLLLLLLLAATITACMAEEHLYGKGGEPPVTPVEPTDPEPPQDNVTLVFRLEVTAGVGSEDHLLDEMDGFTIFLFDEQGGYLRQEVVTREQLLASNNTVTLDMDPGKYEMVCWGNSLEYSMITNLTVGKHISEAAIVHTATQGGQVVVVPDGDPLYFAPRNTTNVNSRGAGGAAYAFVVPEQGTVNADIEFAQAHKKLRVNVENFRGTDAGGVTDCPEVYVGVLGCGYNFLLQPVAGARLAYRNRTTQQAATGRTGEATRARARFNTPLFTSNDALTIDVINPADQKVCYSLNLIEHLKEQNINPEDESIREINIDIIFKTDPNPDDTFDASVAITVTDWTGKPVVPDLD